MREIFFAGFGLFTIACAIGVVFAKNAVYSAASLILSFFGLAALYVIWGNTFIATIQILIYTGAIVVLFVFVVMLLNLGTRVGPSVANWLTVMLSATAVWSLALILLRTLNRSPVFMLASEKPATGLMSVSTLLFTEYLWPFEVLSVFLLALIIAIYVLARPEEEQT